MRSFIISLVLAVILLSCIVTNNLYINRLSDRMLEQLDALPPVSDSECVALARKLLEDWDKQVDYVRLSVGYAVVDRVCEQATTLLACAECGDLYGYQTAMALLRDAIGDMRRLEVLSISNIL